jgi:hypothetical protein
MHAYMRMHTEEPIPWQQLPEGDACHDASCEAQDTAQQRQSGCKNLTMGMFNKVMANHHMPCSP